MEAFEFPRAKPRNLVLSVLYRTTRRLAFVVGHKRFLGWILDFSWATRRIAWEQAGLVFGERFHNDATGLTEDLFIEALAGRTSVLDVGCGFGRWSRIAARHARQVVGIDRSSESIRIAQESTQASNVTYVVGDVLTELAGHFDLALVIHVLEHIEQPAELLQSLRAVSDSLIVEVPDIEADSLNLVRMWLGRPLYTDADHVREYTEKTLLSQLADGGWKIRGIRRRAGALIAIAHRS